MKLTCGKCKRYDYGLKRCKDGKVNPRTYKGTKEVMSLMGYDYVCNYSRHKAKMLNSRDFGLCYHGGIL